MKFRIIFLSFLFLSFFAKAQFPNQTPQGNALTEIYYRGGAGVDSGFHYRTSFADTTAANRGFIKNIPGFTIRVVDTIFVRNSTAVKWVSLGSSGGGGGQNIMNADLTQDADHTQTLNDKLQLWQGNDGAGNTSTLAFNYSAFQINAGTAFSAIRNLFVVNPTYISFGDSLHTGHVIMEVKYDATAPTWLLGLGVDGYNHYYNPAALSSGVTSVSGTIPILSSGGTTPVISIGGLTTYGTAGQLVASNGSGWQYVNPGSDTLVIVSSDTLYVNKKLRIPVKDTASYSVHKAGQITYAPLDSHYYGDNGTYWSVFDAVTGMITQGSNVTITGGGTLASPYVINATSSGGTVTNVSSADANATVANQTTTPVITIVSAPKWQTGRTLSITGDLTYTSPSFDGSGNVTAAGTLATVNSNVGTFNNVTVNGKGLVTAASNVSYLTSAITSLNGLTDATQTFATGTTGTDFAIVSAAGVHTFNIPDMAASSVTRGLITNGSQVIPGTKNFTGVVIVNTSASAPYRTTNGGSNISPLLAVDGNGVTAGLLGFGWDVATTGAFNYYAGNTTRRIVRANTGVIDLVNTANAESGSYVTNTMINGALVQRQKISISQTIFSNTNTSTGTVSSLDINGTAIGSGTSDILTAGRTIGTYNAGTGALITLKLTSGGSGYTNGTYTTVAFTNVSGSGTGATGTVIFGGATSGVFNIVTITARGSGYAKGDVLSFATGTVGGTSTGAVSFTVTEVGATWNRYSHIFDNNLLIRGMRIGTSFLDSSCAVPSSNMAFGVNAMGAAPAAIQDVTTFQTIGNMGFGYNALQANTYGSENTAFGYKALTANTTGSNNVAVGFGVLQSLTTGSNNVGIGGDNASNAANSTLKTLTTGSSNIAIGYNSLKTNNTSSDNISIGISSLTANTAAQNIAIGTNALTANIGGTPNTAVGYFSMAANTTGVDNTAFGASALRQSNTTTSRNTALGSSAGYYTATNDNTWAGYSVAGFGANLGLGQNTGIGSWSQYQSSTGGNNTSIGYKSLTNITNYVKTITITNGGTGYATPPTVTIQNNSLSGAGGSQATATAGVSGGAVISITIVSAGLYYNNTVPTVSFSGGGGSGAAATAVMASPSNRNVAIGTSAGEFITDSVTLLKNLNKSVLIGASTKALANEDSNFIAIGFNTTGLGSNTAQIGDANITKIGLPPIIGVATNSNAAAGIVGEEFNSTISTYTNYTTTATYQNVTSITLTAGDWDLSAFFTYSANTATITAASNAVFVISTTTASAAGATEGQNISYVPQAALLGTSKFSDAITPYRVSLSGTTTYYLNTQATFTLGNPQYVGSIRARRIR